MDNNKGLTLVEVLLSLFIFIMVVLVIDQYYYPIYRLISINRESQEMGKIAKNKMEELKSGYIYIDGDKYHVLELEDQNINFEEENYRIDIIIQPVQDYPSISYIKLNVTNEKEGSSYNLVRYINFYGNILPNIYEEFTVIKD